MGEVGRKSVHRTFALPGTEGHQPQKAIPSRKAAKSSIFNPKRYNKKLQVNLLKNFAMLTNYVEI